jgi:hypothetical protein
MAPVPNEYDRDAPEDDAAGRGVSPAVPRRVAAAPPLDCPDPQRRNMRRLT